MMLRGVLLAVLVFLGGLLLPAGATAAPTSGPALAVGETVDAVVAQVARWQSRINRALSTEVRNIRRGEGLPAVLALLALGFGYGVLHALGPGHGKAVVAAYFMDRSRHWSAAIFAGSWIALGHTISAILIVLVLAFVLGGASMEIVGQARTVEIIAYGLIVAIGLWRLVAGLRGDPHCHSHDHGHEHGHGGDNTHGHHDHGHDHGQPRAARLGWTGRLRQFLKPDAMLGMLTVAGAVPCSGSMILLLFALANGVLLVGLAATLSIALGMALTLIALGFAAVALRLRFVDRGSPAWLQRGLTVAGGLLVSVIGTLMLVAALDGPPI